VNSRNSRIVKFNSVGSVLLPLLLLVSSGASAKDHKPKEADNQAHVVGHIAFAGLSSVDMAMQKQVNGKAYLYVLHAQDQSVSVVDISKPAEPKAVGVIPWSDPAVSSRMNVTGNLGIIADNGISPMHRNTPNDDLVLWDLSNPAAPRVVQKFSGVVKWLQDDRDFIYVLNSDGLWVVSQPADRQPSQSGSSASYGG
jgi:hypothetical protein